MATFQPLKSYTNPDSISKLNPSMHTGLIAIGGLATLSLLATVSALSVMIYRFMFERKHDRHSSVFNQYMILVFNLLFADFLQSLAFSLSFHWVRVDGILAPNGVCWAQAGFLHVGNLASGSFVLCIALHTFYTMTAGKSLSPLWFAAVIVMAWVVALLLTLVGPLKFGQLFFARAGNWCWISQSFETERLLLHYIWIFIDEFGCIATYVSLFIYFKFSLRVRGLIEISLSREHIRANRPSVYMCFYPLLYCTLTLPIATCRMIAMRGGEPTNTTLLVAGALLTSCGWCDTIVYTLMRRVLMQSSVTPPQDIELRPFRQLAGPPPISNVADTRHFEYLPNPSTFSFGDFPETESEDPRARSREHIISVETDSTVIKLQPAKRVCRKHGKMLGTVMKDTEVDVVYSAATVEELASKKATDGIDWAMRHPF